ncbi:MAG: methyl-accepting chemotaxis protein [Spirochaetes bacterium]|nr:methyl-accepting chemotaxis protein [Spirochaetota bacterium]
MKDENLMAENKKLRVGLLLKIILIFCCFLAITSTVLAFVSIRALRATSYETVSQMATSKADAALSSLEYKVNSAYGRLSLTGGTLVGTEERLPASDHIFVDNISRDLNAQITVFVRQNQDFLRISTSITDAAGRRQDGTFLGAAHSATNAILNGNSFFGSITFFDRHYFAGYKPIFAQGTRDVIGALSVLVPMENINNYVESALNAKILTFAVVSFVLFVVTIIVLKFVIRKLILRPLFEVLDNLSWLAKGNFTHPLQPKGNDEIADMVRAIIKTETSINGLIRSIKNKEISLEKFADSFAVNMHQAAIAMDEIEAQINSINNKVINQSASVTETNATMVQITANIAKLNDLIEKQASSMAQGASAMEEMVANINSVTQTLIKNGRNVEELTSSSDAGRNSLQEVIEDIQTIAKESEGLSEINSVMQNIASQTNLLSMNAAIEAAHAGEVGKGFAVVADEIRKLAENSSEQSKTINNVLKEMKGSIDKIMQSTTNVTEKFRNIDSSVKIVAEQEDNIRCSMQEQEQGSKQLLEAIGFINEITQQVKSSSQEMYQGANEISTEINNLQRLTEEMANGMKEMSVGTKEINSSVHTLDELGKENLDLIQDLGKELSVFVVHDK